MMNKLFVKVKCRAYMRKIKDGVYIQGFNPDGSMITNGRNRFNYGDKLIAYGKGPNWEEDFQDVELKDLSSCEGDSVTKKYRERIEEEFTGVVVGYTTVKCEGLLGTDWYDESYSDEFCFIFKETTYAPKVAVVYFKNNCKRYVLLDDLEVLE